MSTLRLVLTIKTFTFYLSCIIIAKKVPRYSLYAFLWRFRVISSWIVWLVWLSRGQTIAQFLLSSGICRHSCFGKWVIDGAAENKEAVVELANKYWVKRVVVLAYNPQANNMIERGHKLIVDLLSKMSNESFTNLVENLPAILWPDRSAVYASTEFTFYYFKLWQWACFFNRVGNTYLENFTLRPGLQWKWTFSIVCATFLTSRWRFRRGGSSPSTNATQMKKTPQPEALYLRRGARGRRHYIATRYEKREGQVLKTGLQVAKSVPNLQGSER